MLNIVKEDEGIYRFSGRFDASQAASAAEILDKVDDNLTIDMSELEYISSMGLGVLMKNYQRLNSSGKKIKLRNLNKHISDVFRYTSLDKVFEIE